MNLISSEPDNQRDVTQTAPLKHLSAPSSLLETHLPGRGPSIWWHCFSWVRVTGEYIPTRFYCFSTIILWLISIRQSSAAWFYSPWHQESWSPHGKEEYKKVETTISISTVVMNCGSVPRSLLEYCETNVNLSDVSSAGLEWLDYIEATTPSMSGCD